MDVNVCVCQLLAAPSEERRPGLILGACRRTERIDVDGSSSSLLLAGRTAEQQQRHTYKYQLARQASEHEVKIPLINARNEIE